ncbi:MAG: ABC transporter ATP-binding protein [Rhodospirillales bacterium]|jgi:branched-chain amino acid transport system ATP-binding protein|nr:ABC transporter ATP-binding protein [Rhodospirillales bacterium]
MTLIKVENLSKSFGGITAVDGLDFSIEVGGVNSIIGPNGAGKTTLFNLLSGVYTPTTGEIFFSGDNVTGLSSHELATVGLSRTFQNVQTFMNMSALENVMVGCHLHSNRRFVDALLHLPSIRRTNSESHRAAVELMEYVGLKDYISSQADQLPYGALKRLEIARALATRPKALLLDEPAAGLNPSETQEIDVLIKNISKQGTTVMLVEHDIKLIMGVSNRIIVLDHGRMLADGTADEIRHNEDVVAAYLGEQGRNR